MKKLTVPMLRKMILQEARVSRRPHRHPTRERWLPSLTSVLFEDADPSKVDDKRFPLPLSKVNPELATKLVQTGAHDGNDDDDVIAVGEWSGTAADLSPSQTSMDVNKAWWFALGMLNGTMYHSKGPGGDLGAFISSDNYIMDGHHRWIATAMAKPDARIAGIDVAFPGKKLVAVLNAATKGLLGVEDGKAGSGGFEQFQSATDLKKALTLITQDKAPNGKTDKKTGEPGVFKGVAGATEAGKALEVIEEWTGEEGEAAIDAAVAKVQDNLSQVPGAGGAGAVMPGAPDRVDMPVIDDDYSTRNKPSIDNTVKALEQGEIDVNEPYGKLPGEGETDEEGEEKEKLAAGVNSRDDLVMEHWQRLAGLL